MAERLDLKRIEYNYAGPTIERFHKSNSFVRFLMGGIGSGKSSACVVELLWRAAEQKPSPDGIRRSRWAIIRSTYPELNTTTIKTFQAWIPRSLGALKQQPPITFRIERDNLEIEFIFLALDNDDDVRKLLSLELTGAWINEAREVSKAVFDALTGRVGRYPRIADGGPTWSGVILDSNPPDDQHWLYHMFETGNTPEGYEIFKQPSCVGPHAENTANLPQNYYKKLSAGKSEDWIKVFVHGEWGYVVQGQPIYPMFRDSVHTAPEPFGPVDGVALALGVDWGLTPAAILGQRLPDGRWRLLDEFVCDDAGVIRFSEGLTAYCQQNYPDHPIEAVFGDPAGNVRSQNDEKTAIEIMREHTGWNVRAAPTNEFLMRREVVVAALNRMVDGQPGLLVSPKCLMLRKGFAGGYCYRQLQSSLSGRQYDAKALKNEYSHPHDALQALLLGGGEADIVMGRQRRTRRRGKRPRTKGLDYDIFNYGNSR